MRATKTCLSLLAAVVIVSVVNACAPQPSAERIASADYGPMPEDPTSLAEYWVKRQLIDPESARFVHGAIHKGYATRIDRGTEFGWVQCGTVDAKDRRGNYSGREWYFVTISNGIVVQGILDSSAHHNVKRARNVCSNVVGAPIE